MAVSAAHKRASVKYNKEKTRQINFRFTEHDADILERLDAVPNKQGYIKALIRADIARAKSEAEATGPAQKEEEQTMKHRLWYAVMTGPNDSDWGTGSSIREEAITMARNNLDIYPEGYVAVIEEGPSPICIEEIHDLDE